MLKKFKRLFDNSICPTCGCKMECYGTHPYGDFTYKCEKNHLNVFRKEKLKKLNKQIK